MNKFTAVFCTGIIALWASNALAESSNEYKNRLQQHQNLEQTNKNMHLRQAGHHDGRELIKTDYKKDNKAVIKDGRKQAHDQAKDFKKGKRDVYEGKKNIRDRDHN